MTGRIITLLTSALLLSSSVTALAQEQQTLARLSRDILDVVPPSDRVTGLPGAMQFVETTCRSYPLDQVRRQIVNAAVQEWAFFGFSIDDQTRPLDADQDIQNRNRRRAPMNPVEAARVADSVGGYWSAAPGSNWILQRQNDSWNGPRGLTSRWRDPWSAAFISWVMCESGLDNPQQFRRAVAHHTYIDQAILARDDSNTDAVFTAYDPGEMEIIPGDLLCRGSRPAYRSVNERREQLGVGARTHCDIVVAVEEDKQRILVIGGNVRGSVRMKLLPAATAGRPSFGPVPYNRRSIFAHLKLKAEPIELQALSASPTFTALNCNGIPLPASMLTANVSIAVQTNPACN